MKLSEGERLIAVMLAEIMEAMKINNEVDPSLLKKLIFNHDDWALTWQYPHLFDGEEPSDAVIEETGAILDMWSFLEFSLRELTEAEAEEAESFVRKFDGFDANNDRHYSVADTLINDLGRWTEFAGRNLNSHSRASLARHREMLPKYQAAMEGWMDGPLALDENGGAIFDHGSGGIVLLRAA